MNFSADVNRVTYALKRMDAALSPPRVPDA